MSGNLFDKDFALERYKYILEQKRELNKNAFNIVAIYQAGIGLIAGGEFAIRSAQSKGDVSDVAATLMFDGLFWLLIALTLFSVLLMMSGISAWLGSRRDEAEFERKFLGGSRALPSWRSIFGWYETYFVVAMILISAGYCVVFRV